MTPSFPACATDPWNRRTSNRLGKEESEFSFGCTWFEELRHVKTSK